ncbi:hypothetical protein Sru01_02750 [Sphaerisporangium rufum]|uniref:Uncharacterized protein n=1 Tax=Sphaerisporangium rufum TaxID=1381558 RepID=A0A919QXW9_9ACTN|nr:DUF6204 family protein [Sphaerisporangium rufum]GII75293.1 hypothetical protein Sru01_02750 [Sphaerisporangium rufum]
MFRVTIRGRFAGLDDAGRAAVRAASGLAYTEEGMFTHDPGVTAFTFRCQVPVTGEDDRPDDGPDDGEDDAALRAMAALDAYAVPHEIIHIAVTDLRSVKVRRKGHPPARPAGR